ncbi:MAG: hypothetical protein ACOCXM_07090 [Myxococcota bacterium]
MKFPNHGFALGAVLWLFGGGCYTVNEADEPESADTAEPVPDGSATQARAGAEDATSTAEAVAAAGDLDLDLEFETCPHIRDLVASPSTVASGREVDLTADLSDMNGGATVEWSSSRGVLVPDGHRATLVCADPSPATVQVTAESADGCTDTLDLTVDCMPADGG